MKHYKAIFLAHFRREAKSLGLKWNAVLQAYQIVKNAEIEKRRHANEVRQTAWCMATSSGCWPFWRHGFCARFADRIACGCDITSIPKYDAISQEISWYFPEYGGPDGTERLWDFLLSPYDKIPDRETMLRKAIELAEY